MQHHFAAQSREVRELDGADVPPRRAEGRLERAGFRGTSIRPFRLLPNSSPPAAWLPVERAIVDALPLLSTHVNVISNRPRCGRPAAGARAFVARKHFPAR
jgi:hypothetical protein